jgi:hypothetical protein
MTISRRNTISMVVGVVLPALLFAALVSGQTPERERLTEPTYRVSKSTDVGALKSTVDPTMTPSAAAAIGTRPEIDSHSLATDSDVIPAGPTKVPADMEVPEAPLSESEIVFGQAMADAAAMLAHIQDHVDDYTCTFIKRESVKGKVVGPQYIYTKVRSRKMDGDKVVVPLAVYMKFLKPSNIKGREVLYIEGQNKGKIVAKEGGIKGKVLPAISLPPTGRLAMRENRYPITEFGVETLTKRLLERGNVDPTIADCTVVYKEGATVCGRLCRYLEVRREAPKTGKNAELGMNVPLARVFTDIELDVPIRYVAYEWPVGDEPPQILEEYTYQNLKINVGLTDLDFDKNNPKYGF